MGLVAEKTDEPAERLIAAGRSLVAQGDAQFSLTRLCAEAGVTLEEFRANFASKAALLQQLMDSPKAEAPPPADPWLERRLRVFERALGALEEKADKRERELRHTIARLEERLCAQEGPGGAMASANLPAQIELQAEAAPQPVPSDALEAAILCAREEAPAGPDAEPRARVSDESLQLAPLEPAGPPSKADSEFLEAGRRAALAHARALEQKPRRRPVRARLVIVSALAAVTLLLCAVLTLSHADYARGAPAGESTTHRLAAATPLENLEARADSGDAGAQRDLAYAYLRGQGVTKDVAAAARWAQAAAEQGDVEAQYLAASLYRDGAGVTRDPARAFAWFAKAAAAGNLKAMHNLAIAYIEGSGTARDDAAGAAWFAKAAARGYVDSAFDLAVLYEKGQGVTQDARQALRWYRTAAAAGDMQAAARAALLAQQARL